MRFPFQDYVDFLKQFRTSFTTTGAIAPSSRFLAHAMVGPMKCRTKPARILEVGPGTGAVTRYIVQLMGPDDRLDLVELNEAFARLLQERFQTDRHYKRVAQQSEVHVCPLQDFQSDEPYDFIISGLPLNNFPPQLVDELFQRFIQLLKPDGVLSYFEYMYIRSIRAKTSSGAERERVRSLNVLLNGYLNQYRFRRSWVFINLLPAWVQHLRIKATDSD